MWIQPHGNLAVFTIRHDLFGPGRFALIPPGGVRVDHPAATAAVQVHVVEKTVSAAPADCHRCDHGAVGGFGADPPAWQDGSASSPAESGGAHGFAQGQVVPASGGLLDVMA